MKMNGDQRARYLYEICAEEPFFSFPWQVIVDVETGVAYSMDAQDFREIPRICVAIGIDEGFRP